MQPTSTPLGSLLLCEVLNVTSRSDDATGFTIQCQYRNYECFADSESDRDAWVAALHSAAESGSGGAGASAAADPLGLLDELVTVVEPSYAKHVDAVTSGYATLRENLLMSQQRASVKAAGLEVARDDIALLHAKLAQLEAARAESEARAAAAEEIAQQQAAQLASFNNKLTVASTAAVGLQCVVDEGRRSIQELRLESGLPTLVPHSPPKPMAGRDESVQEEASRLTVEGLSVTLDSIEKLASQLYDRTHEALSEQAEEARALALENRMRKAQQLREEKAAERILELARKKYKWRRVAEEELSWEDLAAHRVASAKVRFEQGDLLAVVKGEGGGAEVFEISEEEKEEAARAKQANQREAAKEKLRAMKEKKRKEQAEKAARLAAEEKAKAEAEPEPEPEPEAPVNDMFADLMGGGDEPEPASEDSGSDSEDGDGPDLSFMAGLMGDDEPEPEEESDGDGSGSGSDSSDEGPAFFG